MQPAEGRDDPGDTQAATRPLRLVWVTTDDVDVPDSDDDITTSEPSEPNGWTNHPLTTPILLLSVVAVCVIVTLFLLRHTLKENFAPCGRDAACSVSNAPGP